MKKKVSAIKDTKPRFDEDEIRRGYEAEVPLLKQLCEEAHFILQQRLEKTEIKIHLFESRVKAADSMIGKAKRNNCDAPLKQLFDLAGVRVVCLFRDDLPLIDKLIRDNFRVLSDDNKLKKLESALGYQSIHYVCELPKGLHGARYENIQRRKFEIQLRTLCMHCWASVSHYIDYKGDWDVPQDLRYALNALSGLFYVADTEFQQFNAARLASRDKATQVAESKNSEVKEINFDTISALMASKFPARRASNAEDVSNLVQQIKLSGYSTIKEIEDALDSDPASLERVEASYLKRKSYLDQNGYYFRQTGAIRVLLENASPKFKTVLHTKST